MHLADAFIQSNLHWQVGRVRGSCLRTPTGGSTFHIGDLNPGHPLHYPVPIFLCIVIMSFSSSILPGSDLMFATKIPGSRSLCDSCASLACRPTLQSCFCFLCLCHLFHLPAGTGIHGEPSGLTISIYMS